MRKIYLFINKGFQHETNSYLPFSIHFAGPPNFIHGTYGIFISGAASIGKNCSIYQQVTIGSNMLLDSKHFGSPQLGDNCLIGAGAKIIGNIKIGNNCRIGANAVVTHDLPNNSIFTTAGEKVSDRGELVNKVYQYSSKGWVYQQDGKLVKEKELTIIGRLNNQ